MGKYKLMALDMDGTLLNSDGTISAENKKWIAMARADGIEVTLASGRHRIHMEKYAQELALSMPFVTLNGCEVWTPDWKLLDRTLLTLEQYKFLRALGDQCNVVYRSYAVEGVFDPDELPQAIDEFTWLMLLYRIKSREQLNQLQNRLLEYGGFELSMSSPSKLDVNPAGISKARGLQIICDRLNIKPQEVVVMGDGLNDIAMMKWAGLSIAMDNAVHEVKQAAQRITDVHTNHGVAKAIQALLKEGG